MINTIGWIGNIFFILGAIFLAKKWIVGWHCQILGNVSYVLFALLMGLEGMSLCALSILLIVINIFGLKKWSKKQDEWIWVHKI